MLVDADLFGIEIEIACCIDELVADNADTLFGSDNVYAEHARIFDLLSGFRIYGLALCREELTGAGIYDILRCGVACKALLEAELIVEFIPADTGKVISLIEEQRGKQAPCALLSGRLAGALTLVYLDKALGGILCGVLFKGIEKPLLLAEDFDYLGIGAVAERAHEGRHMELALAVNLGIKDFVAVGLEFKPCTGRPYRRSLYSMRRENGQAG